MYSSILVTYHHVLSDQYLKKCCVRFFSSLELKRLRQHKIKRDTLLFKSARGIQLMWRVASAKTALFTLRKMLHETIKKQNESAKQITNCYRQFHFRRTLNEKVMLTRKKKLCAISIQCFWRMILSIESLKVLQKSYTYQKENSAAIIIQKRIRQVIAINMVQKERFRAQNLSKLKSEKALKLTGWWRLCAAKRRVRKLRMIKNKYIIENFALEIKSASKIAALWRGKKGRDVMREKIRSRKARWKQMWSDLDNKYFYYNQVRKVKLNSLDIVIFLQITYKYSQLQFF